jgi:DNA-binding transcriptional ArsR family regulator
MTAKVVRLRPKRHDAVAEALQLALDMPLELRPSTRDDLAEALGRYQPPPESWTYTMINPDQLRTVLRLINACPLPSTTLRVWTASASHVREGSGEIMAGRDRLAADAGISPQHTSRALSLLTEMGVLIRLRPGRYAINPHVAWNGSLATRETAARKTPQLRVVEP